MQSVNPIKIDRLLFPGYYQDIVNRIAYYLMGKNRYDVKYFEQAEILLEDYFKKDTATWGYIPTTFRVYKKPLKDTDYIYVFKSFFNQENILDLRDVDFFKLIKIKEKGKRILSKISFSLKNGDVVTDVNQENKKSTTDFFNILHKANMEVFIRKLEIKNPDQENEEVIQTFNLRIAGEKIIGDNNA